MSPEALVVEPPPPPKTRHRSFTYRTSTDWTSDRSACLIGRSVRAEVTVEPRIEVARPAAG